MVKMPRWIPGIRQEVRDLIKQGLSYSEVADELGLDEKQVVQCEESWQEIHSSYDHTPDEARPKEFIYEVDEVKALLGPEVFERVGDMQDSDIHALLLHVEGELETKEEKERADKMLDDLRAAVSDFLR